MIVDNEKLVRNWQTRNDRAEDILHSSGFAQTQSGSGVGAAGGKTFAERQAVEQRRKMVQGYKNSRIVNTPYNRERARTYTPKARRFGADYEQAEKNPMDKVVERAQRAEKTVGSGMKNPPTRSQRFGF